MFKYQRKIENVCSCIANNEHFVYINSQGDLFINEEMFMKPAGGLSLIDNILFTSWDYTKFDEDDERSKFKKTIINLNNKEIKNFKFSFNINSYIKNPEHVPCSELLSNGEKRFFTYNFKKNVEITTYSKPGALIHEDETSYYSMVFTGGKITRRNKYTGELIWEFLEIPKIGHSEIDKGENNGKPIKILGAYEKHIYIVLLNRKIIKLSCRTGNLIKVFDKFDNSEKLLLVDSCFREYSQKNKQESNSFILNSCNALLSEKEGKIFLLGGITYGEIDLNTEKVMSWQFLEEYKRLKIYAGGQANRAIIYEHQGIIFFHSMCTLKDKADYKLVGFDRKKKKIVWVENFFEKHEDSAAYLSITDNNIYVTGSEFKSPPLGKYLYIYKSNEDRLHS